MKKIKDFFTLKTLDWYVIKSYFGPFVATFLVSWFVLIMQFLWMYIDDMIGKGIDSKTMTKLITYSAASLIPMALPLAMLLSSIMTMGKFGEDSELTAAKASGISIFRFFKGAILFSIVIAIFAFYYSNYIYTKTRAVYQTLLTDIRGLKPALLIKPKTFYNGISGFTIRVEKKDEKTGELFDVKIYNHSNGKANESLLTAKRGIMSQSEDGEILIMKLDSGILYQDEATNSFDNQKFPFYVTQFDYYEKRFDLNQFKLKTDASSNPDAYRYSLNLSQLNHDIDSSRKEIITYQKRVHQLPIVSVLNSANQPIVNYKEQLKTLTPEEKERYKIILINSLRNSKNFVDGYQADLNYKKSLLQLLNIEWHRKFTLAISCIVLFFVGAPLGAIIKKGGIGLPMFLSVILFIIYYVTGLTGAKLSEAMKLSAFLGSWLSTLIFLPLGLYLTYLVRNDSQIMNLDSLLSNISFYIKRLFKKHGK